MTTDVHQLAMDDVHRQAIESIFAEVGETTLHTAGSIVAGTAAPPAPRKQRASVFDHEAYRPAPRAPRQESRASGGWAWIGDGLRWVGIAFGILLIASNYPGFRETPRATATVGRPIEVEVAKPIQNVRVGDRIRGKNPLREQVDSSMPDPDQETWRKLSLMMIKASGKVLDVTLLRHVDWIEGAGAVEGESFFLDLPEMGAVGDARVLSIDPCPPIHPGTGNVVTGTFHHEADSDTRLLRVDFSNGSKFKGVTDSHPIYSVRHNAFVAIGQMQEGDYVKLHDGLARIEKMEARIAPEGQMLFNIETHREHVYEVNGILVHNNCLGDNLRKAGSYGSSGAAAHHIVAKNHRFADGARKIMGKFKIDLDSHWNGAWLPGSAASRARGAIHPNLHTREYFDAVEGRLSLATSRAEALAILQGIRHDLLNGTFPGIGAIRP